MGLKRRLVVAFLILLLVPTIMFSVVGTVLTRYQQNVTDMNSSTGENPEASYYILNQHGDSETEITLPFYRSVMVIVIIILCTAVILVAWLYRSIIKPLNALSAATRSMQQGNLDFTISGDPNDELGQLCEDFEEMRLRMKEQIDARLKYESDTIELISNISHDLKTPLTAIKGYAEGIMDGVADTEDKRKKYLKTIYTKASDMQVLVDELSFYSKIDSNIVPYNYKKLDIKEYFNDCVEDQSLDMEVKNIRFTFETDVKDGTIVTADPEQLRRVVNNVIGNAQKYMDKQQGCISINLTDHDSYVQVEIADNGAGISEKDLEHIFERFYRADASRNSKKGGSGLGLAIAKKIIEDHDGTITAKSTVGLGTNIIFTLPKCVKGSVHCDEIEDAEYTTVDNRFHLGRRKEQENG